MLSYFPFQEDGIKFLRDKDKAVIGDAMGVGKEQPISALIPTPSGFVRMGDIKVGDKVFGKDGNPITVTGVFPQGVKDIYRVHFRGGSYADCGLEHLWTVRDFNFRRDGWKTLTTEELINRGVKTKSGHNKYQLPLQGSAQFINKPSKYGDPYLIGVILGDGCFSNKAKNISVSIGSRDKSIIDSLNEDSFGVINDKGSVLGININAKTRDRIVEEYGLQKNLSKGKAIPEKMFTLDVESRWELLKGLMDTDGSCHENRTSFHTISPQLAEGVKRLVHSLGGVAIINSYDRSDEGKGIEYQVNVKTNECPFTVDFKKDKWRKPAYAQSAKVAIEKIEKIGKEEAQCIMVDAEDHLYQTGIWHTVTHNTIQGIGIINDNPTFDRILIVCPSSLKINWERELDLWLYNRELDVKVVNGNMLHKEANINIVNYDRLDKCHNLRNFDWDLIIFDEAHYLKNDKAKRTRAVMGYRKTPPLDAKKVVMLTGTPMTNRPADVWTICHYMQPNVFKDKWAFLMRYCDPKRVFGRLDFSGSSNLEELHRKMQPFMIRRLKKDVLPQLPDKQYQVIELNPMGKHKSLIKEELSMTEFTRDNGRVKVNFEDTSRIRKELGEAKVPAVVARLKDMMEEYDGKIVVFAHHRSVIEELVGAFGEKKAVVAYGGMSGKAKQESIDRFNNDPEVKLFIGSISSAGIGITLTVASVLVFAEMSYSPSEMDQAEDRIHRATQKSDSVNILYFVYRNSLDSNIAHSIVDKKNIIGKVIDGE